MLILRRTFLPSDPFSSLIFPSDYNDAFLLLLADSTHTYYITALSLSLSN